MTRWVAEMDGNLFGPFPSRTAGDSAMRKWRQAKPSRKAARWQMREVQDVRALG